ncbi:MAG: hypothetical protein LBV47_08925 [Bacteroidales bacterium]|nr:hypothetical protein [Bacteroidales bacterium]
MAATTAVTVFFCSDNSGGGGSSNGTDGIIIGFVLPLRAVKSVNRTSTGNAPLAVMN